MPIQRLYFPGREGQRIVITAIGTTHDIASYGTDPDPQEPVQTLSVRAGEVNVLPVPIVNPSKGSVSPRPDGGSNLDLRGLIFADTLTAELATGEPVSINVAEQHARDGWGDADHYMLETNASGDLIIEPGRQHYKIWVTQSAAVYDATKIATEVGGGMTESQVTGAWLRDNTVYGRSEAKAITGALAKSLMSAIPRTEKVFPSVWIYMERGFDWSSFGIDAEIHGESPLHPHLLLAWGAGSQPEDVMIGAGKQYIASNIVAIGVEPSFGRDHANFLVADVTIDHRRKKYALVEDGQNSVGTTFYRATIHHASGYGPTELVNGVLYWHDSDDRSSGTYLSKQKGILIEKCIFWKNGYEDGFAQDRIGTAGAPPSALNHNVYLSQFCLDTTIRNTLSMQGASTSWQFRSGGWLLNNLTVDDCIHASGGGVDLRNASNQRGVFSAGFRQVATSAGYLTYNRQRPGANNRGFDIGSNFRSFLDTMVIHRSNPDDAAEMAARPIGTTDYSLRTQQTERFNGVSYRWTDTPINTGGLNMGVLDTTTIQRFAASKTGSPTTIPQLGEYILTLTPQQRYELVADGIEYFLGAIESKLHGHVQDPYRPRATPISQTFAPLNYGDGFRWDHPLNWTDKWVPGQHPLDDANLSGCEVKYLIDTRSIDTLTFAGGHLLVSSGKLTVANHADAARVTVHNCGQYIAPLGAGDYIVRGGRLVLPENITSVNIEASGQGELCLPLAATIAAGKKLRITGGMGWAGWDQANGAATLTVSGALEFEVTPILKFGYFKIDMWDLEADGHFRGRLSGFEGDYDSIRTIGNGDHRVRVRNATGPLPADGEVVFDTTYLVPVPEAGTIVEKSIATTAPGEIGKLEIFRSGRNGLTAPAVTGSLVLAAGSTVSIIGRSYLAPGTYDLTGPGVTVTNNGATLPPGVSVFEGRLVLDVA